MTTLFLDDFLGDSKIKINLELQKLIPKFKSSYASIYEAAHYTLFAPSKRLRPLFILTAVEALGGDVNLALTPASAIEMLHTYSLIHDDLPCMDDDDLRRGQPTLHKVYAESHAVLAGDFLLTQAFDCLANAKGLTADQRIHLVKLLAKHSGGHGMIGGQVIDIESEGILIRPEELKEMHLRKTAALFIACMGFAGIIAGADAKTSAALESFGQDLGLAFQIIDDILDVTADETTLGKPSHSDIGNNKSTYVSLLGLERSKDLAEKQTQAAMNALQEVNADISILENFAKMILKREY